MNNAKNFIDNFTTWAENEENIQAVGLVGSHAKGTAKPDSDIDLMIIVRDKDFYIKNSDWINNFGEVERVKDETWGNVKTKRLFYKNGLEVEYNFDTKEWANPKDPGTKKVVSDGMKILVDKEQILRAIAII